MVALLPSLPERLPATMADMTHAFALGDVDGDGDTDVLVVAAGQSRLLLNDALDRLLSSTNEARESTLSVYDAFGRLLQVTDTQSGETNLYL